MKKTILIGALSAIALFAVSALAIQEYAGLYQFNGKVNQTIYGCINQFGNCYAWGLISDEDTTETVTLEASPEIASYVTMPASITLEPHTQQFVNVSAFVPCKKYDIVCDGKIDMRDLSFAAKLFGCTIDKQCYNFSVDLNKDGKIDILDISTIARHFGENYGQISGTLYATIYGYSSGSPIVINIRLAKNVSINVAG